MAIFNSILTRILFMLWLLGSSSLLQAQDTLPKFSAAIRSGNKILISWTNPYDKGIRQLSIQRSKDSTRMFTTIMTVPDPTVLQNGYVDAKAPDTLQFYRLYILLDSGKYSFSSSQRPHSLPLVVKKENRVPETISNNLNKTEVVQKPEVIQKPGVIQKPDVVQKPEGVQRPAKPIIPEHFYVIKRKDSIIARVPDKQFRIYRDSIQARTKDTIVITHPDTVLVKVFVPKEIFNPSRYVFTDNKGILQILLPDAGVKKYRIKFFEADKSPLFEIKEITEKMLVMDKSNFMHAGWYLFELYENGVQIEKNQFYIAKDF